MTNKLINGMKHQGKQYDEKKNDLKIIACNYFIKY
jgi:hypothetical protein